MLTIISYHFIRNKVDAGIFSGLHGRTIPEFHRQLDFLDAEFSIVSAEEICEALASGHGLPEDACWLTFDDGYLEHYTVALPALIERGIQGSFFIPVNSTVRREILDVNMIHLLLANVRDTSLLVKEIEEYCGRVGSEWFGLKCRELWWCLDNEKEKSIRRWTDSQDTLYVKMVLQRATPHWFRKKLIRVMFSKFICGDIQSIVNELYMSQSQVKELIASGMYVGGHGARHEWMSALSRRAQTEDIMSTVEFLKDVGASSDKWIYCYPYGDWDSYGVTKLQEAGCVGALTNLPGKHCFDGGSPMAMPRFDTNDFPF
jgi:peptidoglycan/xylan/chitin deacetylase (PgdA/CDA1 family)